MSFISETVNIISFTFDNMVNIPRDIYSDICSLSKPQGYIGGIMGFAGFLLGGPFILTTIPFFLAGTDSNRSYWVFEKVRGLIYLAGALSLYLLGGIWSWLSVVPLVVAWSTRTTDIYNRYNYYKNADRSK